MLRKPSSHRMSISGLFHKETAMSKEQTRLNEGLHQVVQSNDFQKVQDYLAVGADINSLNKVNDTPLLNAIRLGRSDLATMLIQKGADVNIASMDHQLPIELAQQNQLLGVVEEITRINQESELKRKEGTGLLRKSSGLPESNLPRNSPHGTASRRLSSFPSQTSVNSNTSNDPPTPRNSTSPRNLTNSNSISSNTSGHSGGSGSKRKESRESLRHHSSHQMVDKESVVAAAMGEDEEPLSHRSNSVDPRKSRKTKRTEAEGDSFGWNCILSTFMCPVAKSSS